MTERISDFLMDAESEGQCSYSYSCYFNLLSITHASGNCKNLMSSLTANTCPWWLFQSVRGSASDLKAAFWQKREIKKEWPRANAGTVYRGGGREEEAKDETTRKLWKETQFIWKPLTPSSSFGLQLRALSGNELFPSRLSEWACRSPANFRCTILRRDPNSMVDKSDKYRIRVLSVGNRAWNTQVLEFCKHLAGIEWSFRKWTLMVGRCSAALRLVESGAIPLVRIPLRHFV